MRHHVLAALLVAALLAGCATRPGDLRSAIDPALAKSAIVRSLDEDGRPIEAQPNVRMLGNRNDVLVLSGGGSDGAFGAGLLAGWTASGKRPDFDVVTGVSTGALMATLAFLGPSRDEDLKRAYTSVKTTDIYKKRGVFGFVSAGALFDRKPLENTIASIVDETLLDQVAVEYRKGRRLYVASTDLDAGLTTVWDMGKIASSKSPGRMELYRKILAASASIPGAFPPVYIAQGEPTPTLHVDGGVKVAVLFRSYMVDPKGTNQHVWTVVNGHINYRGDREKVGANAPSVVGRTISEMLRMITLRSVQRVYTMTRNASAQFRLAYVPETVQETDPLKFDPIDMGKLFDAGFSIGKSGNWSSEPPRMERLERMP